MDEHHIQTTRPPKTVARPASKPGPEHSAPPQKADPALSAQIASTLTQILLCDRGIAAAWLRNALAALDALILEDGATGPLMSAVLLRRDADQTLGRVLTVQRHESHIADEISWGESQSQSKGDGLGNAGTFCQKRSEIVAEEEWKSSAVRRKRNAVGVDEFLQLAFGVPWVEGDGVLILRAELPIAGGVDTARVAHVLELLAPAVRAGFIHSVAEPERHRQAVLDCVSVKQRPVVERLVEGLTEREISVVLEKSPYTVHDHVKLIYKTLGISSRFELLELWAGREPRRSRATARRTR